ncbi:ABC-2 transporter permease [Agrococcus sp. Marseille-P2731]|uniref:ABC-2 transporter permease n=1 Tax=Agrococcus sp. Marseille-P2731 TaxID=1841862 RepID=UPI0009319FC9|nr:ABC-2 transporter permease [Agrococcus sp. Marseille-P2731]
MTLAFTRLDLLSWCFRTQTLLPLALIVVVGVALPIPGMAIVASAFVTSLVLSVPFLGDERDRLDTLYGVLPVSRRAIVVGRAASLLIYGAAAALVALAATLGITAVRGTEPAPELLIVAAAGAFAFVGIAMAVQLPVLFRVGYSRGRLIVYAPALVIAAAAWVAQATGNVSTDAILAVPLEWIVAACAAIGVIGIVVGVAIAARLYARREIR